MVQWLRLQAANAGSTGLISGQGTKIQHAKRSGKKKKIKVPCSLQVLIEGNLVLEEGCGLWIQTDFSLWED